MEGQGAGIMAQTDVQQLPADCGLLKPPYSIPQAQMTNWNTLRFRLRATFDGHTSEYCSQAPEAQQTGSGEGIYEHGKIVTDVKSADHGVTAYFDDLNHAHSSTTADHLIAADGMRDFLGQDYKHGDSGKQFNALSVRTLAKLELTMRIYL